MAFASGSAFGAPQNTQTSLFGAPKPSGGSIFGTTQPAQQQTTTGGLFGQPAQQQQTASIFGQPNQQQQSTGGLFGQSTQQPTNSLFGQQQQQPQQQQQQQQQPTGSIFGQPTTQPAAGGLFGQSTTQPAASGGLFGQSTTQPAGGLFGQSTAQPAAGGLFGQSTTQPAGGLFGQSTTQPASGGLFGQSTTQTGGLFGQATQQQQPQQTSLFGSTNTQPQQQTGGLFGNALQSQATVPAGGFSGGGLFGGNQQQQTMGLSAATSISNTALLSKSTKFNDLPEEIKRTLESIDSHIQGRVQISKDLHQRKLGDEPLKAQELLRGIHKDLVNTTTQTRNDSHLTKDMKAKVEQAVQDTIVATRIVDAFKAPQGSGAGYLKDHAEFPLEFFTRVTETMKQRLAWYKSTIEAQHATFIALASKTAALDADLQKIKVLYTQLWRAKTGSVRDPFNDLDRTTSDRGDYGMQSLGVK
ncbi:hypothetical protein H0H81_011257 [Sphagnurus paluster]|uniref:Nucleoporin p58/p45 n=1 Tax=Sphagnurus paluster TaxID=117069 RepID=A0A9P7FUN0_9AGAR|nr:hypothetical protein H0H81_011257 [Sphagnurus paluster]